MKFLILLVVVLGVFGEDSVPKSLFQDYLKFKNDYNKKVFYGEREMKRFDTWVANKKMIEEHNEKFKKEEVTYDLGMNEFGDMTSEEIKQTMLGAKYPKEKKVGAQFLVPNFLQIPATVDWRTKGYVTGIKNQGMCGSCWAFSAVGSLEGQHFKKSGKLVSLSEQNLVDCSGPEGDHGCQGGWMDNAFEYVEKNGGIDTEDSYPYKGYQGKCNYKPSTSGATDTGFSDIPHKNETALQAAIASVGPISVAIDASQNSFQFYRSGVYDPKTCSQTELDHGVLAVGYGSDPEGGDYYIVKNSWGTSWGQKGYIWMARNKNNKCGIASAASYPLV